MINVIATIVCLLAAIVSCVNGNFGLSILNAILTLINLPLAVNWIRKVL